MKNYEYPGAIHIHSTYSDGTANITKIIKDARKAGLKWIIITDHDSLEGFKNGYEGFHDDLCVLIGTEISPEKGNHYLAFDVYEQIPNTLSPAEFITMVNDKGGFGFVAHPDESSNRDNKYPALRWDDWNMNGFQGIEVWNHMSDWVDTLNKKNKFYKFLFPDKTLTGPTPKVLQWWDTLNNQNSRIFPAIAGLDVHGFKYNFYGVTLTIFPYFQTFKTLQNFIQIDDILSRDINIAKKQIYSALKSGNNLMVNNVIKSPVGMSFTATKQSNGRRFAKVTVGEILSIEDDFLLNIVTPYPSNIKLFHNGNLIQQETTNHLKYISNQTGSYRFEAYLDNRLWIISNPIRVIK